MVQMDVPLVPECMVRLRAGHVTSSQHPLRLISNGDGCVADLSSGSETRHAATHLDTYDVPISVHVSLSGPMS